MPQPRRDKQYDTGTRRRPARIAYPGQSPNDARAQPATKPRTKPHARPNPSRTAVVWCLYQNPTA